MIVYVVLTHIDYEGDDLEGVFSTKEKAQKFVDSLDLFIATSKVVEMTVDTPDSH